MPAGGRPRRSGRTSVSLAHVRTACGSIPKRLTANEPVVLSARGIRPKWHGGTPSGVVPTRGRGSWACHLRTHPTGSRSRPGSEGRVNW